MFKKLTWYFIIITSTAGFVLLSSGFYNALKITNGSRVSDADKTVNTETNTPRVPAAGKDTNTVRILIMGDSVAKGTGDEKGKGFSTYLPDYFKNQTPKDIQPENIGVDGLQSNALLKQLEDKNLNPLITGSDFIVISIGGNDLRRIQSSKDILKDDQFRDRQENYLKNLKDILKNIRNLNADACIIFVGLYNPYDDENSNDNTRLLNIWNHNTQQTIEEDKKAVFIPTYDIFKFNLKRYIAPDGLHPNTAGYQAVSSRISKSVEVLLTQ